MNEKTFKKNYKFPACTKVPFEYLIPYEIRNEVLSKIKQESIEKYGEDRLSECTKRKVCFTQECIGRPLPDVPSAKPYLDELAKRNRIVGDELFVTGCGGCPIAKTCTYSCSTVNDMVLKQKTQEPSIYYNNNEYNDDVQLEEVHLNTLFTDMVIPWDVLTSKKEEVVKMYIYKNYDFKRIAELNNLNNQAEAKYVFYSALNRLSEYGVLRKFIEERINELTDLQIGLLNKVYLENKSFSKSAFELNISKQSASNIFNSIINKYKIKWQRFVVKKEGKIIYLVPELMK